MKSASAGMPTIPIGKKNRKRGIFYHDEILSRCPRQIDVGLTAYASLKEIFSSVIMIRGSILFWKGILVPEIRKLRSFLQR